MTKIKDDLRYRVGIDVGLKSIGFCAVEVDENDQPLRLLNSMVFIHDAGVDPSQNTGSGPATESRKYSAGVARRTRRLLKEKRRRLARLDALLSEEFGWPLPNLDEFEDPYEPWHTRAELADHYIEDETERTEALSIAIRHIARHRGWRNPYSSVDSLLVAVPPSKFLWSEDPDLLETTLNGRVSKALGIDFAPETTPGQLISAYISDPRYAPHLGRDADFSGVRERRESKEANATKKYVARVFSGRLLQSDNAAEIRQICKVQRIDEETQTSIIRAVFHAKSPKGAQRSAVGHDQLPGQEGHIRAEKAHPSFQLFRIVTTLTNLRIKEGNTERHLTSEELRLGVDYLFDEAMCNEVTWLDLARKLGVNRSDLLGTASPSYDGSPALRLPPTNVTSEQIMTSRVKWLKEWWKTADNEQRGYMIDALSNSGGSSDDEEIKPEIAQVFQQATEEDWVELDKIQLQPGRASYSVDSLEKLTEVMLRDGVDLYVARQRVFRVEKNWEPTPEAIGAPVGNPAVNRVFKQVARWLKMVTERWGTPTVINIEHSREGLKSARVVEEIVSADRQRARAYQRATEEMLTQLGVSDKLRRSSRLRYFAVRRQGSQCLYCGCPISYETAELDHIVPRANSASTNVRSNLAAVCHRCNLQKGKVPFALWTASDASPAEVTLKDAIARVRQWKDSCELTKTEFNAFKKDLIKRLRAKSPEEEFDGRSMESVAWMAIELRSRIAGSYRNRKAKSAPHIGIFRGRLTAEARKASGFENRVNLIGGRGKTRFDRRHHAMDALVIALMNESVARSLAWRENLRESQRITGEEETWKRIFDPTQSDSSKRFEQWRTSMLRAVELFNVALAEDAVSFVENIRLRVGSSKAHDDTIRKFDHMKLGEALPVAIIDRAETPALWTALTRLPDFDPKSGLPEDPTRDITVHGRKITADEDLNFFASSAACLKLRGGYVGLGNSIHHARVYRIDGKKPTYAMVRVFATDLVKMAHEDVFTTPLKPSAISMRTADPKIRRALEDGTATQIGWLVEGDELQLETDKYSGGLIGKVLAEYPQLSSWRVAGFYGVTQLRLRPYMLAAEGIPSDASESLRKVIEGKGWLPSINALLSSGCVKVVRRNCLGEPRFNAKSSLPVSQLLR